MLRHSIVAVVLAVAAASRCPGLGLVVEGKSRYAIVIPDRPTAAVTLASRELQTYIERITGAKLPVLAEARQPGAMRIYLGPCKATAKASIRPPGKEGFVLRVRVRDIFIVGEDTSGSPLHFSTRTGTLYGVSEFLRRFGKVRWLWPGELGTVAPKSPSFTVPDDLNLSSAPDFKIRALWLTYRNPKPIRMEHGLWQRHTGQGSSISGGAGHAYTRLLGGNKWFKTHPEYYAKVKGKRRAFYGRGLRAGQVCTSNPAVVRICAESATKRTGDIVSIAPNDGSGFCECEKCRALDVPTNLIRWRGKDIPALTDRVFTFANAVAAAVRRKHPGKLCGHYCYTFFKKPPARLTDLEDNILLYFAQGCHWFRDPELKKTYRGYISRWAKFGNPMVSREYYGLIYWHGMPNVHTRLIEEDIKYLKARGFIGMNSEMCRDFATHGPNYYLAARLLWDTRRTRREILDDYYRSGFGPAAGDVAEYFDVFERRLASLGRVASGTGSRNINSLAGQFDASTIASARRALDRAYAKTADPTLRARLDFVRMGWDYTDVTSRLLALGHGLNAAGMSLSPLDPAVRERTPSKREFMAMLKEAKRLNDRRWLIIRGQGDLPVVHTPALEFAEKRYRWTEQLNTRCDILANESGRYHLLPLRWRFHVEKAGDGETRGWHRADFDGSKWRTLKTNQIWEKQGLKGFDGVAWYRVAFDAPADKVGEDYVLLRFGAVDESSRAWLNGEKLGEFVFDVKKDMNSWRKPLDYEITGKLKTGRNVIALRVEDRSGAGGLWKPSYIVFGRPAANLIADGSFERGGKGIALRKAGAARATVIANDGYESDRCLEIVVPGDPKARHSLTTTVAVEAQKRYALSFRYKTKGVGVHPTIKNSPAIRVIFRGADRKSLTPTRGYSWGAIRVPADTTAWQEGSYYFQALPKTRSVSVTIFFHRPGTYRIDDLSLTKLR